ncbi:hypothetical protein GQ43DRAFT_384015, partial [Delitschia confertaspora ATCC 74209]
SHVVTHRNTNWPVRSLSTADRTGSPIFSYLWSYVIDILTSIINLHRYLAKIKKIKPFSYHFLYLLTHKYEKEI